MKSQGDRTRPDAQRDVRLLPVGLLLFALVSLMGNEIGSVLRYPDVGTAVLFPPYAALTAALVVSPRRDWIGYILIDVAAHLVAHFPGWSLSWIILAGVADIVRALVAAALLKRFFDGPPRLDGTRPLCLFVISAVIIAPAAGATIGALNVIVHVASQSYRTVWSASFLSNALTGLTMLPAFISGFAYAIGAASHVHVSRQRLIEAGLLGLSLCTTCAVAFLGLFGRQTFALPLYAPLPVLIWAALRFGAAGASVALTAVTFSAIWSVDRGTGPFLSVSPDANVPVLQIFVLFTAVAMLCLAAIATAREAVAQLHKALLASLQDHVAILDGNGVVLEVNDSWRRFAETLDVPFFHGVRAGDNYLAACQSSADYGNVTAAGVLAGVSSVLSRNRRRFEIEYEHDHDNRRDAYTMIVEALERTDGGAVVIRSNVTTRRQAQMEIEEQRRQLSHLARVAVLGQLSGAFAHELNQPLTAILSNAEAAREVLRRRPDAQHHVAGMLDDIVAADRRASAVIHRLRALLKRGDRRIQVIDTKGLIEEVLELAHTELITRRIEVTSIVSPILPALWGDRVQLQQVLLNLILNGCEAMVATVESDRRLVLTAETDGPHSVHFAVRDSGSGIGLELMDRLFEPFVTTKPDGLGLGLSISRTIVAAHGGRLWASNNSDGGATMHCVLPVTEAMHVTTHSVVMPTFAALRDE